MLVRPSGAGNAEGNGEIFSVVLDLQRHFSKQRWSFPHSIVIVQNPRCTSETQRQAAGSKSPAHSSPFFFHLNFYFYSTLLPIEMLHTQKEFLHNAAIELQYLSMAEIWNSNLIISLHVDKPHPGASRLLPTQASMFKKKRKKKGNPLISAAI